MRVLSGTATEAMCTRTVVKHFVLALSVTWIEKHGIVIFEVHQSKSILNYVFHDKSRVT